MALTDPNALTGTITICVDKTVDPPEFKDFYPKTETSQIADFNAATIALINNKISNLTSNLYMYKATLLVNSWTNSNDALFPKQYIINNDLITDNDIPEIAFTNITLARAAGINSLIESQAGKIIITAKTVPLNDLNIFYYIYKPSITAGEWTFIKSYMPKLKLYSTFSLFKSGWQKETITVDNTFIDRYKYDINMSNVNANDVVDICIPDGYNSLYPITQASADKVTLYSYIKPTANINNISYRIYKGTLYDEDDYSGYMPRVKSKTITIEPYEWFNDVLPGTDCKLAYTINDNDIKSTDLVEIIIQPNSLPLAKNYKINSIAITKNGQCTIYCINRPKVALQFSYNIYHCKSVTNTNNIQDKYMKKRDIKNDTLIASNWVKTNKQTYPYAYTLSANCKKNDAIDIIINNLSQKYTSTLYPLIEIYDGYIYIYSKNKPVENIDIEYYIFEAE